MELTARDRKTDIIRVKSTIRSKQNSGFTLVETLVVVGIIVILMSIAMIFVPRYIDSLKIAELDNAAREIFMAAENRTQLLSNVNAQQLENLVKKTDNDIDLSGRGGHISEEEVNPAASSDEKKKEELYYIYNTKDEQISDNLLTYAGIDPSLLDGDFYIVYDLANGSVTDVFYAEYDKNDTSKDKPLEKLVNSNNNSFEEFYTHWANTRDVRLELKNASSDDGSAPNNPNKTLVGWYNGKSSESTAEAEISPCVPFIKVKIENGEFLTVKVEFGYTTSDFSHMHNLNDINNSLSLSVKLYPTDLEEIDIELLEKDFKLKSIDPDETKTIDAEDNVIDYTYTYTGYCVLDSLTGEVVKVDGVELQPHKFADLVKDGSNYKITPGDNFFVNAAVTVDDKTVSAVDKNNSLFQEGSGGKTAYIRYLRHLQNLDAKGGYVSGVPFSEENGKNYAVQSENIFGEGFDDAYPDYKFHPITNESIYSYDGHYFNIMDLNLRADLYDSSVGLFSRVSKKTAEGTEKPKMKLSDIRMVNTTMTVKEGVTSAKFVGALAGEAEDTEISNCWVYWNHDDLSKLAKGPGNIVDGAETILNDGGFADCKYQLVGETVGGLVGYAKGSTTITRSLAATLIEGVKNSSSSNSSVGGLVGRWSGSSSSDPDIWKSYADCYLTGDGQAAGLIGDLEENKSVKLENCYASGFIMSAGTEEIETPDEESEEEVIETEDGVGEPEGENSDDEEPYAGLCMGEGSIMATNVYSVMLCAETDADTEEMTYSTPYNPLTDKSGSLIISDESDESDVKVYFIGTGEAIGVVKDADGNETNKITISGKSVYEMSRQEEESEETEDIEEPEETEEPEDTDFAKIMGSAFEWKNEDDSHPYELLVNLDEYLYPGLKNMPHYCDWGKPSEEPGTYALVYYELYMDDTYGIYGVDHNGVTIYTDNINIQTVSTNIKESGYAVAYLRDKDYEENFKNRISVTGKTDDIEVKSADAENVINIKENIGDKVYKIVDGNAVEIEEKVYLLLETAYDDTETAGIDNFYMNFSVNVKGSGKTDNFFFNPHFAKTVKINDDSKEAADLADDLKMKVEGTYGYVIIRTPEQLDNLREYKTYYHHEKLEGDIDEETSETDDGYRFSQELHLVLQPADYEHTAQEYVHAPIGGGNESNAGDTSDSFNGVYDGGFYEDENSEYIVNHTVSGLNIDREEIYQGLFGYNTGTIRYVTVGNAESGNTENEENDTVETEKNGSVTGLQHVGSIVGYNAGTVENCNNNSVTVTGIEKSSNIGGIVGSNAGTVTGCDNNSGQVTGYGDYVGGIAGYNAGMVSECDNDSGNVTSSGDNVGGIVGWNAGTMNGCKNIKGNVTGSGNDIGGIVGHNTNIVDSAPVVNGEIENSDSAVVAETEGGTSDTVVGAEAFTVSGTAEFKVDNSSVTISGSFNVGGVAGYNEGTVKNYITENIMVTSTADNIGGIVGYNIGTVNNCTSNNDEGGNVYGTGEYIYDVDNNKKKYSSNIGGIVGLNDGNSGNAQVYNCDNKGNIGVKEKNNIYVGGIVGYNKGGNAGVGIQFSGSTGNSEPKYLMCRNYGEVLAHNQDIGGIVGYNEGKTYYCINYGNVTLVRENAYEAYHGFGGVAGTNYKTGEVIWCYNKGSVEALSRVGGIAGYNYGVVEHCGNIGNIISDCSNEKIGFEVGPWAFTGGVIGVHSGYDTITESLIENCRVQYCWNTGNVMAYGKEVGGVVGRMQYGSKVIECYNTGDVSGYNSVGGIVGHSREGGSEGSLKRTIESCYNKGNVHKEPVGDGKTKPAGYDNFGYFGGILGNSREYKNDTINDPTEKNKSENIDKPTYIEYCYNIGLVNEKLGYTWKNEIKHKYYEGEKEDKDNYRSYNLYGLVGGFFEDKKTIEIKRSIYLAEDKDRHCSDDFGDIEADFESDAFGRMGPRKEEDFISGGVQLLSSGNECWYKLDNDSYPQLIYNAEPKNDYIANRLKSSEGYTYDNVDSTYTDYITELGSSIVTNKEKAPVLKEDKKPEIPDEELKEEIEEPEDEEEESEDRETESEDDEEEAEDEAENPEDEEETEDETENPEDEEEESEDKTGNPEDENVKSEDETKNPEDEEEESEDETVKSKDKNTGNSEYPGTNSSNPAAIRFEGLEMDIPKSVVGELSNLDEDYDPKEDMLD